MVQMSMMSSEKMYHNTSCQQHSYLSNDHSHLIDGKEEVELESSKVLTIQMDIFDEINMSNNICIVQQCNSIRRKAHGFSLSIIKKLGDYGDVYSRRTGATANTAYFYDRPECGTIEWSDPPILGKKLPYIAHLFAQFDSGLPLESNRISLTHKHLIHDEHFQRNKRQDTKGKRLEYFRSCLSKLASNLNNEACPIDRICFPHGIGCGLAGGDWPSYERAIREFEKKITQSVVIAKLPSKCNTTASKQ